MLPGLELVHFSSNDVIYRAYLGWGVLKVVDDILETVGDS